MAINEDVLDKLNDVLEKIADNKEKIAEVKADVNAERSIQNICTHCGGDGLKYERGKEDIVCPDCGGDGVLAFGRITLRTEE